MGLQPKTETLMRELLERANEEGIFVWGFTMDDVSNEIGQFGNFDPKLHFDNSVKALAVTGNSYKEALRLARLKEN